MSSTVYLEILRFHALTLLCNKALETLIINASLFYVRTEILDNDTIDILRVQFYLYV